MFAQQTKTTGGKTAVCLPPLIVIAGNAAQLPLQEGES